MDKELPEATARLGVTVGSATCLEGVVKGKRLFRVKPGNCCDHTMAQASVLMDCSRRASFIGVMETNPHWSGPRTTCARWPRHLVGVCSNCDTVVAIPPQSSAAIRETRNR